MKTGCVAKLHPLSVGLAMGLFCGLGSFLLGVVAFYHLGLAESIIKTSSPYYAGYDGTLSGAILLSLKAFVRHFLGGFIIAWFYNLSLHYYGSHCCCTTCPKDKTDLGPHS